MATTEERIGRLNPPWQKCPPAAPDDRRVQQLLSLYPERAEGDGREWAQSLVAWQRRADSWERLARQLREQS